MRGILLWLIGLPIPIIILLYVFHVIWLGLYFWGAVPALYGLDPECAKKGGAANAGEPDREQDQIARK